jgi:MSHA pilin protein MshA
MRRDLRMNRAGGFTLIELVVVITILGILAAFAVPRFISLQTNARAATVQSLHGALRSAASVTHSMWLITGGSTVAMEGATIDITNGYPTYDAMDDTLVDSTGFSYNATTGVFASAGAANPATCSVTYTPPAGAGSPPTFLVDVSDCN